jgi:adenylate cyclase
MADLIAQGMQDQQRWRRGLPEGETVLLGRSAGEWSVPWDEQISRRHVQLTWSDGRLHVRRVPTARNPVFVVGEPIEEADLRPGDSFVSGETTFTVTDEKPEVESNTASPVAEQEFRSQDLQQVAYRDPDRRLSILSHLPELIAGATGDAELFIRLGNMLLAGIPQAEVVALVNCGPGPLPQIEVLYWDRRTQFGGSFRPSQRLILRAIERKESVLHVRGAGGDLGASLTVGDALDWAFCTPVRGESTSGWGLYVAGQFDGHSADKPGVAERWDLRAEVKFTELVAALLSSLRQVRLLQRQQALLGQFFSPAVLSTLGNEDATSLLAPRETRVSVLFCDLRGFSAESERFGTNLLGLLERVSKALGVMTRHILDQGGVIADFQGDAALGFWGWPLQHSDVILRVCQAALAIRTQFDAAGNQSGVPLAGFRAGIGIATGTAVAGKIGTQDQAKVGAFGPVVNLGSRLEGMTKILYASVLMDEATAQLAREQVPPAVARLRRVACVRPYGLDRPLMVTELLPPVADYPALRDEHIAAYERALSEFQAGRWPEAYELLHKVPPEDRVKDFLTIYIAQRNRVAPPDWNGVIVLSEKR